MGRKLLGGLSPRPRRQSAGGDLTHGLQQVVLRTLFASAPETISIAQVTCIEFSSYCVSTPFSLSKGIHPRDTTCGFHPPSLS